MASEMTKHKVVVSISLIHIYGVFFFNSKTNAIIEHEISCFQFPYLYIFFRDLLNIYPSQQSPSLLQTNHLEIAIRKANNICKHIII